MYEPRRKILWFAVFSRLAVLILQFIFNLICPDHYADAFRSPVDNSTNVSMYDRTIDTLFGGLTRWDGQYFIHIAKYGYTYENTLAFYPLFPMTVRVIATVLRRIFYALNFNSATIVAATLLNFACFVKSALIFYDLSKSVLRRTSTAYKASVLYCINPASIFFTAAYSESFFAYLTFYSMLRSIKLDPYVSVPLGLSGVTRSNGTINIGFPAYLWLRDLWLSFVSKREPYTLRTFLRFVCSAATMRSCWGMLNTIIISIAPFALLQVYDYVTFCIPGSAKSVPLHVVEHAKRNDLILAGNGSAEWCEAAVPLAYSHVQKKYWNVGFLKYYEFKQIPNFILALPILYVMLRCIMEYYEEHGTYFRRLGFANEDRREEKSVRRKKYPADMLVFIVHGLFLTVFCILFVHVQVSTRLISSASPLMYWYCASTLSFGSCEEPEDDCQYESEGNVSSKWKVFFMTQKKYSTADKLVLSYFLGYTVVGCFMFPNFLPWT